MKKMETTLLLLIKDNNILLGKKKRGFGEGKYNGIGGKVEPGETIEEAMIRETQEEICVTPTKYYNAGKVSFLEYYKGKKENVIFHLYIANEWEGTPKETEEMEPCWFKIKNIPYDKMFPDDKYWLPKVLNGNKIEAFFEFDEEWNILRYDIKEESLL